MKLSIKSAFSIIGAATLMFCLMGCAGNAGSSKTYSIGETVETDIVSFTLDRAELTIALGNSQGIGSLQAADGPAGGDFFLPKEYDAADDTDNPFVAPKGHTLVSLTFSADNLDRQSVNLDGTNATRFIAVEYNGKTYTDDAKLYHKGNEIEVEYGAKNSNDSGWKTHSVSNILLSAGEKASFKCYADIPVEISDLNSPFKVTFNLPNSAKETVPYTYLINQ